MLGKSLSFGQLFQRGLWSGPLKIRQKLQESLSPLETTAALFKDKTLEVFGLKTAKIVDIMPTVLPVSRLKRRE